MHQRDIKFATALNYIRMNVPDKGSPKDNMLQSHELHLLEDHADYSRDAMHVYAQNAYCGEWNRKRLDQLCGNYTLLRPGTFQRTGVLI